jgi:hypothetical protein
MLILKFFSSGGPDIFNALKKRPLRQLRQYSKMYIMLRNLFKARQHIKHRRLYLSIVYALKS